MTTETPRKSCEHFLDDAFRIMKVEPELQQLLRSPYREIRFELPLKRDDGSTSLFYGYRVQHNQSRGPFKGALTLIAASYQAGTPLQRHRTAFLLNSPAGKLPVNERPGRRGQRQAAPRSCCQPGAVRAHAAAGPTDAHPVSFCPPVRRPAHPFPRKNRP